MLGRLVIGLIVGIAGGAVIAVLNVDGHTLVAPLVALVGGLTLGVALGWRRPGPGRALGLGLLVGGLAGLLMAGGQLVGVWQALASPRAPEWLRTFTPGGQHFWWLAGGLATLCLLLAAGFTGALAGVVSAWTGYHAPPSVSATSADGASDYLLPGTAE